MRGLGEALNIIWISLRQALECCSDEYLDVAPTTKAVGSGLVEKFEPTALVVGALRSLFEPTALVVGAEKKESVSTFETPSFLLFELVKSI